MPEFSVSPSSCGLTYSIDIADSPLFISPVSDGRGVDVQSDDISYIGEEYLVTVTAMVDCGPLKSLTYKLTMTAPPTCE